MIHNRRSMSCAEFSARMAGLIAAGEDIFAHPHVRKCKLHRALLEELETIARVAKQMFPEIDPPETVWDGLQARMAQEQHPFPIVSDPWPGCRVAFVMQVIESYNPHASPPPVDRSSWDEKLSIAMQIFGATHARREGRHDR